MTTTTDLIKRLRDTEYDDLDACKAADLIERQAKQIEELGNKLALDIHSCHANCSKSTCVNRRLREQLEIAREALESIAKNTCCGTCREAAIVSDKALTKLKEGGA